MPNKKPIIIIAVLSVLALGLGYWVGLPKDGSDERVEASSPTIIPEINPIVEKVIRNIAKKPTGKLTKADFEKVTKFTWVSATNKLTDVKGIEKLTHLTWLDLRDNPNLTKGQIHKLQKALPRCDILSNPKK